MPRYGEKLNEAVQNLRIKLYVMSFDSVQIYSAEQTMLEKGTKFHKAVLKKYI